MLHELGRLQKPDRLLVARQNAAVYLGLAIAVTLYIADLQRGFRCVVGTDGAARVPMIRFVQLVSTPLAKAAWLRTGLPQ